VGSCKVPKEHEDSSILILSLGRLYFCLFYFLTFILLLFLDHEVDISPYTSAPPALLLGRLNFPVRLLLLNRSSFSHFILYVIYIPSPYNAGIGKARLLLDLNGGLDQNIFKLKNFKWQKTYQVHWFKDNLNN